MKKTLSMVLCVCMMLSSFIFAPLSVAGAAADYSKYDFTQDIVFDFAGIPDGTVNPNGWGAGNVSDASGNSTAKVVGGSYTMIAEKKANGLGDPMVMVFGENFPTGIPTLNYTKIIVGMEWKNASATDGPQFFFATKSAPNYLNPVREVYSTKLGAVNSTAVTEFTFDMASHAAWALPEDNVSKLRFDPGNIANATYSIKYVKMVSTGKAIYYNGNGGTSSTQIVRNLKADETAQLAATATRPGYIFKGWALTKDATVADVITSAKVLANENYKQVYAVWELKTALEFTADETGISTNANATTKVENGALKVTLTNGVDGVKDSASLYINDFSIPADVYSKISIGMKNNYTSDRSDLTVYFKTNADNKYTWDKAITKTITKDDATFVEYTFDFVANTNWIGTVNSIFLSYENAAVNAGTSEIDYIRFQKAGVGVRYNPNTTDAYEGQLPVYSEVQPGTNVTLAVATLSKPFATFIGWGLTPNATTPITEIKNIQQITTVYAIWDLTSTVGFDTQDPGFSETANIQNAKIENGIYSFFAAPKAGKPTESDANFQMKNGLFKLPTADYNKVIISMKYGNDFPAGVTAANAQFFFSVTDEAGAQTGYSEANSAKFATTNLKGSTEFQNIVVDLSAYPAFMAGKYFTRFRFDPIESPATVYIDYIKICKTVKIIYASGGAYGVTPATASAEGIFAKVAENKFVKAGKKFVNWTDGTKTYNPGERILIPNNDITLTAVWADTDESPIIAKAFEFNTDGNTDGITKGQNVASMVAKDGILTITKDASAAKDPRIGFPVLNMDPSYGIMKVRVKSKSSATHISFFYTRVKDGTGITDGGVRQTSLSGMTANATEFEEVTYDVGSLKCGSGNWDDAIYSVWMDTPNTVDPNAVIEYDYIRFYLKGNNTLTYDKNTTDAVTKIPAEDNQVANGTGYILSSTVPVRVGYVFLGWSKTATGAVVANNTIDIAGNTTVYAKWEKLPDNLIIKFTQTVGSTDKVNDITARPFETITLPAGYTKAGYAFIGWNDGVKTYNAGDQYKLGALTSNFVAQWSTIADVVLSPANGSAIDYNKFAVTLTYPEALPEAALVASNFGDNVAGITVSADKKSVVLYFAHSRIYNGATVKITTKPVSLTGDPNVILRPVNASYTVSCPDYKGGEMIANGDFELPYSPAETGVLSTDAASGKYALYVKAGGAYQNSKFRAYVQSGKKYWISYDAKILNNQDGSTATTNISPALKVQDGNDKPLGGDLAAVSGSTGMAWKHAEGLIEGTDAAPIANNDYVFLYTNPSGGKGVDFMLDNVSFREAFENKFVSGSADATGKLPSVWLPVGKEITLPDGKTFIRHGFDAAGWTDGTNTYAFGDKVQSVYPGTTFTVNWTAATPHTISFATTDTAVTGTAPATITGKIAGDKVALPANTFVKADHFFLGWTADNGVTVIKAGAEYTLISADVVFAPVFCTNAIMGSASNEFEDGQLRGWRSGGGLKSINVTNGILKMVKTAANDSRLVWSTQDDLDTPMDSAYSILKIRYRMVENDISGGLTMRWNRSQDRSQGDIYFIMTAHNAGRIKWSIGYPQTTKGEWHELTVDLAGEQWTDKIEYMVFDILSENRADGQSLEYDYVRLYRKGDGTIKYDGNAPEVGAVVDNLPTAIETNVSMGTGYMLSPEKPTCEGYAFMGWSTDPLATSDKASTSIDVWSNDVTAYAIWALIPDSVVVSFDANGGVGTMPSVTEAVDFIKWTATVTLPECTFTKTGMQFNGWDIGGRIYKAGQKVELQFNAIAKATWIEASYSITYDGGAGVTGTMENGLCKNGVQMSFKVNEFAKAGYRFAGWKYEGKIYTDLTLPAEKNEYVKANYPIMPDHNVTVTANWVKLVDATGKKNGESVYEGANASGKIDFENGEIPFESESVLQIVADPTNANNNVMKVAKSTQWASLGQLGILVPGQAYYYSAKVYVDPTATINPENRFNTNWRYNSTDHVMTYSVNNSSAGAWYTIYGYGLAAADIASQNVYISLYTNPFMDSNALQGYVLYDDIVLTPVLGSYTLDAGVGASVEETTAYTVSSAVIPTAVPTRTDGNTKLTFKGWSLDGINVLPEFTWVDGLTLKAVWASSVTVIGKLGDVDGNGTITSFDASKLLQHLAQLSTLSEDQMLLANTDGIAGITSFDASLLLQYLAQIDVSAYGIGTKDITK